MSLFLDLLFPRTCFACGQAGDYLCPDCIKNLAINSIVYQEDDPVELKLSLFKFTDPFRLLIHSLKYEYITDLVDPITQIAITVLNQDFPKLVSYWQDQNFVFVPVPIHSFRRRYRGFNQSALLAWSISQSLGLKYQDLLIKIKNTPAQVSLVKSARISSPKNKFIIKAHQKIPQNIILLDDVCTTGATLNACSCLFPDSHRINYFTLAGT